MSGRVSGTVISFGCCGDAWSDAGSRTRVGTGQQWNVLIPIVDTVVPATTSAARRPSSGGMRIRPARTQSAGQGRTRCGTQHRGDAVIRWEFSEQP